MGSAAKGRSKRATTRTLSITYKVADDYRPVYCNGVFGGISGKGEFVINFFQELNPLPESTKIELTATDVESIFSLGEEQGVPTARAPTVQANRVIVTGVTMSLATARSVADWLNKHLDEAEKKTPPREEEESVADWLNRHLDEAEKKTPPRE